MYLEFQNSFQDGKQPQSLTKGEKSNPAIVIYRVEQISGASPAGSTKLFRQNMGISDFAVDPRSGFCAETRTFHSLRPTVQLPPENVLLSADAYTYSLRAPSPGDDSPVIINSTTGQRLSYSEFVRRSKTLAAYLQSIVGLNKGDAAYILSNNLIQVPVLYFALLSLGVVVSPANPINTKAEVARQTQLCRPVIAFTISTAVHKIPKLRYGTIVIDSFEFELMMTSPRREMVDVKVSQSDLAGIMYSSGTTGNVKGVMVTHRNLIAMTGSYMQRKANSPVVLLQIYDLEKTIDAVEKYKVTDLAVAPPVVVAMSKKAVTEGRDLSSLETVASGGAPLGKELIEAFTAKFPGTVISQGYGMTEVIGRISEALDREECSRWGSSGKFPGIWEAKIVDQETGASLPPLKRGELWVKGPSIMKGYVNDPKATSETLTPDGWLRTGDLCYIDEDGFLFIVDRLKELIKYKGYQVAPAELEHLLQSHPQIVDAAVIPYPDDEAGQVPMAFIVRRPESKLDEAQVMDFIAKQVAPYKKIRRVSFVTSIPKNASGKILRKELKKISLPESFPKL
ncbi:unnamed protein product, partial [Vitis vinifera]